MQVIILTIFSGKSSFWRFVQVKVVISVAFFTQELSFWRLFHSKVVILAIFSGKIRHFGYLFMQKSSSSLFFRQKSSFGGLDSAARGRTQFHSRILIKKKGATHNENPPGSRQGAAKEPPRITLLHPIAPGMLKNRLMEQEQQWDKGHDRI